MAKDNRLTFRRRHSYNTKSNKVRKVKTPGGRLTFQYLKKKAGGVKCGDCKVELHGIPHLRPFEYHSVSKRTKTVSRSYGGSRCATCTKSRIVRAFLVEEQKIVKRVLKEKNTVDIKARPSAAAQVVRVAEALKRLGYVTYVKYYTTSVITNDNLQRFIVVTVQKTKDFDKLYDERVFLNIPMHSSPQAKPQALTSLTL